MPTDPTNLAGGNDPGGFLADQSLGSFQFSFPTHRSKSCDSNRKPREPQAIPTGNLASARHTASPRPKLASGPLPFHTKSALKLAEMIAGWLQGTVPLPSFHPRGGLKHRSYMSYPPPKKSNNQKTKVNCHKQTKVNRHKQTAHACIRPPPGSQPSLGNGKAESRCRPPKPSGCSQSSEQFFQQGKPTTKGAGSLRKPKERIWRIAFELPRSQRSPK